MPPAQRPVPNYAALRKMGVVDFEGSSNPEVVDAWLVKLTRTLDELRIDNHEDRIAMAVHVLQGTARDWWHTQPESEEVPLTITWDQFLKLFRDEYIPDTVREGKMEEFMSLRQQWGQSVAEYTECFKKLLRYADPAYRTAEGQRDRYVMGLRADLKRSMGEAERATKASAYRAALRIEKDEKTAQQERTARFETKKRKAPTNTGGQTHSTYHLKRGSGSFTQHQSQSEVGSTRTAPMHQLYPICQKCDKRHLGECKRHMGICFQCGEPGHIKPHCPQLMSRTRTVADHSVSGGRPQSGWRPGGRTGNSSNHNSYNNNRDQSQMSRAGGQPRIFAMRREEADAAPEVVTGAAGNQEYPDQTQGHSCCPKCHHKG
ncbi:unnamed protein product [Linum trigynum]|uniref:CCHC-type domain-containing protein n=1 Tax=Linum trigynum TaxID=586398 RepID=A0AAV2GDQ2_9ROSI